MGTTFCRFKNLKQDINTSNAVKIFQQAASLGHKSAETLKEAQQFIEEHFEKVLKDSSKDFTSLSFELLFQLLVSDKLNITNERPVWEVIKEWVKADMEARLETNLLMLVKKCLRFGRLPEGFVEEFIFSSDLFAALPKSKRNHLIDYMNKILKKKQPKKQTSEILKTTDEHQHCFKPPPYSRSLTPFCPRETKQFLVCLNYNYRQLQTMVEYYDYQLKLWRPSPFFPMPPGDAGIFALQAVDDGQRLFLFGGYAQRVSVAATWTIDLAQPLDNSPPVWTPKCPMLTARHHFSSVQLDGAFLYALGGETQEDCIIADCERYDIATDCWTAIAPMNVARSKAAAAVLGGQIYIAGGCCPVATSEPGDKYLTTVEVYDPQTNRWQLVAPMTTARIRFALVPFEGRLWAIAGQTTGRSWLTQLSSCESYDPQTDTWREEPAKLNKEHSSHQAVNFRGQLYLVGGEREYLQTDWTERYEPESKSWLLESPLVFNHLSHQLAVVPANCLAPFITPPPEAVENDAQTESQIKKHFFKFLSLAIAFLAAAVYFCIFGSSTLSQWPGGPLVYIAGFFLFLLICVVALATDFFQIGFSQLNDWQILERLKHPSSLLPFIDRSESLENKKTKYVRGDSCEEYDIKHFYCISLAYYNFEHFNRNIIRKLPYRDDLTKEKIKYIKENFRMGSLEQNKKGVEEFERTLRRAKFTVSKLPEGCKTEADTARFLRKELKQFKYEDKVCLVIYISSHGVDGAFFCEDGLFTVRRLIDQLNLYRALSDSPKVIIVDTCRVREEGGKNIVKNKNPTPPWPTDDIDESLKRQDEWWNPEPFQLLTVFSCLRKYYSYSKDGGLYTLKLTDVLKEHCSAKSSSPCLNLYDLFNIAQDRARAQVVRIDSEECYQVGIVNTQLNYDIILNELEEENEEKMKESKVVEDEENESSEEDEESEEDDEEDDEEDEEDDEESDDYAESDEKPPFEFERFFGSSYSDL